MTTKSYHVTNTSRSLFTFTGDYLNVDNVYEDITDIGALKKRMLEFLDDYNQTPNVVAMDLVLFRDAIEHSMMFS